MRSLLSCSLECKLIIHPGELDKTEHIWLGALSGKLKKQDMTELLVKICQLTGKRDRELADSLLEVSVGANRQIVEEMKGDANMCQALMEIMEPQLLLREKEGLHKGIQGTVEVLRELGHPDSGIKEIIIKKYGLSAIEAEEYF